MNVNQILRRLKRAKLDDQITFRINSDLRLFLKEFSEKLGVTEGRLINAILEQFQTEEEIQRNKK